MNLRTPLGFHRHARGCSSFSRNSSNLVFHIFGFADFVVAVGTGLTLFLLNDPRMAGIQTLPMALIPLYGVGISGANHIMAFDLLCRQVGIEHKVKGDVAQA